MMGFLLLLLLLLLPALEARAQATISAQVVIRPAGVTLHSSNSSMGLRVRGAGLLWNEDGSSPVVQWVDRRGTASSPWVVVLQSQNLGGRLLDPTRKLSGSLPGSIELSDAVTVTRIQSGAGVNTYQPQWNGLQIPSGTLPREGTLWLSLIQAP